METILSNGNLTAKISSKGAELTSLRNHNREYIWEGDPKFWAKHSPVLFPIVGTLKNNEFTYESKKHSLSRHGFARDMEFECIRKTQNVAVFSLQSTNETLAIYPFEFEFQIIYTLSENNLQIAYNVINRSTAEMYFSVGAHPAFALPLAFEDYAVEMEKEGNLEYHLLENDLLSEKTEIITTNNKTFGLNYKLFENDALIFKHPSSQSLTIIEKEKPLLRVNYDGFPYLGIWTKTDAPFICIEPWFGHSDLMDSNGNLIDKAGIQTLEFNATFECAFSIEIL